MEFPSKTLSPSSSCPGSQLVSWGRMLRRPTEFCHPILPPSLVWFLWQLKEKFGEVFTIQLGPRRIVVLCGFEAIKEALVDQGNEFRDRGQQASFDWIFQGHGVFHFLQPQQLDDEFPPRQPSVGEAVFDVSCTERECWTRQPTRSLHPSHFRVDSAWLTFQDP